MCWNIILTRLLGSSWPWSYCSWIYNYLCNQCLSPLMLWARKISIRARCTTLCDKVWQWHAAGRWFSLGSPISSANKTDRHDIAEILLKVVLNTRKPSFLIHLYRFFLYVQSFQYVTRSVVFYICIVLYIDSWFVLFLLAIMLSVLIRFTASD